MNRNIKPLKESKKEMLFSGLHVLLTAGLDFSHSFRLLIEEEKEEKIRLLLKEFYASEVLPEAGNSVHWIVVCCVSGKRRGVLPKRWLS